MTLQRLTLRNFQAHEKVVVDLNSPITTITGPSDAGKSAILRALLWLATNRPSGSDFIRHGAEETVVTLAVDDSLVKRKRSKKENTYKVNGTTFKAMGAAVPPAVANLLNLSDVNVQRQHDAPFWLALSAGQVASELHQVIDLGIIDSCIAHLSKTRRTTQILADETAVQLAAARDALEALDDVPAMAEAFQGVIDAQAHLDATEGQREALAEAIGKWEHSRAVVEEAEDVANDASTILRDAKASLALAKQRDRLKALLEKVTKTEKELPAAYGEALETLLEAIDKARSATREETRLRCLLKRLEDAWENETQSKRKVDQAIAARQKVVGLDCPLCGNALQKSPIST